MREVTLNMEQLSGRIVIVEKSVDNLISEVRRSGDVTNLAAQALDRIAKAEEDRATGEKERNKILRDAGRRSERWFDRVWETPATQLLLTGVVMAVLQFLGVAYMATKFQAPLPAPVREGVEDVRP
jgi:hypothetical protein